MTYRVKSVFLIAIALASTIAFASNSNYRNSCSLGSTCPIMIDKYGNPDMVEFDFPQLNDPIGTFTCVFKSSDPSVRMGISAGAGIDGYAPNIPIAGDPGTGNMIMLPNNQPTQVPVTWTFPGQPHPHIVTAFMSTQNQSGMIDPKTVMSISCS